MDFVHSPENTVFWKPDLFPSTDEGKETPTLLGPLGSINFNHCTRIGVSFPIIWKGKHPISETLFPIYLELQAIHKVRKPSYPKRVVVQQNFELRAFQIQITSVTTLTHLLSV
jgi:hypothetical protein